MTNKLFIAGLVVVMTFGSFSYVLAAPYFRQEAGLVPLTDSTYYLGTTTPSVKAWAGVVTDQLCLNGDCQTAWPSSSGGSGTVSTSTNETAGFLPYWTSTSGTPALLGKVATTSVTCTGDATCDAFTAIGAAPVTINVTSAGGGSFAWTPTTNYGAVANATSTPIWFQSGLQASSTSRIASTTFAINGNVGIGIASPTSPLHVVQTDATSNAVTIQNNLLTVSDGGGAGTKTGVTSSITLAGTAAQTGIMKGGSFSVALNGTNSVTDARGLFNNVTSSAGDNSGNLTAGYALYNEFGVGNSPTGNQITSAYGAYNLVRTVNSLGRAAAVYGNYTKLQSNTGGRIDTGYGIYVATPTYTGTFTNNYGLYVADQTGPTNSYAAVFAGGNVGIGTTSPYAKLSVVGETVSSYFTATTTTATSTFLGGLTAGNNSAFVVNQAAAANSLTVSADGKVGIGTADTVANTKLYILETTNLRTRMRFENTNSGSTALAGVQLVSDGGTFTIDRTSTGYSSLDGDTTYLTDAGGGDIVFKGAADIMRLKNAGNVGIGTTSPYAKLSVHANNGDTNTTLFAIGSSTASATTTFFTVNNAGNVGIKTAPSTGTETLKVSGTIKATSGFTVENSGAGLNGGAYNYVIPYMLSGGPFPASLDITSSKNVFINIDGDANDTGTYFAIGHNGVGGSGTALFSVLDSGNTGIGTSTPYAKLTTWGTDQLFEAVNNASTTIFRIGQGGATTTSLGVTNLTAANCDVKSNTDGSLYCGTDSTGSGSAFAWTPTTNFGVAVNATSTPIWFDAGLMASSTSRIASTTFNLSGQILGGDGTVALPTFSFSSDPNTGFYWSQADTINVSTNATLCFTYGSAGLSGSNSGSCSIFRSGGTGTAAAPNYTFNIDPDTGLFATNANFLGFTTGGVEAGRFDSSQRLGLGTTTPAWMLQVATSSIGALFRGGQLALTDTNAGANLKHWLFASQGGSLYIGTSTDAFATSTPAAFSIGNDGKVVANDATNKWSGTISPTRSFVLGTGTTTTWTASTTGSAYSPYIVMPFAGTLRQVRCATDASFLGVNVTVNASNATPSYFVASTTVGKVSYTAGNTFTAGQKILANFGTTTTATATSINCTFDVTET